MSNSIPVSEDDLIKNPTPRVPIVLCLDTSYSMSGDPISELQEGMQMFFHSLYDDETAKHSAEVSVVTFGGTVEKFIEFTSLQEEPPPPRFQAAGHTPMGEAVVVALDSLEARKSQYQNTGVDYYQPWLVLMTDGAPTDHIEDAVHRVERLVERRTLSVFAIGIGSGADMDVLARFSPNRHPLRLDGLKFKEFFEWLSKSVQRVSASHPGQNVELDTDTIKQWGIV